MKLVRLQNKQIGRYRYKWLLTDLKYTLDLQNVVNILKQCEDYYFYRDHNHIFFRKKKDAVYSQMLLSGIL